MKIKLMMPDAVRAYGQDYTLTWKIAYKRSICLVMTAVHGNKKITLSRPIGDDYATPENLERLSKLLLEELKEKVLINLLIENDEIEISTSPGWTPGVLKP